MAFQVAPEFGYVVFSLVATFVTYTYLGVNVGRARKKYDVKYPTMYSDKDQVFNCYQRAHQNMLEQLPLFLVFLLVAGVQFPVPSAIAGLVWNAGRIVYAHGYYTGDPAKRNKGAFSYLGFFALLGMSIYGAVRQLNWV
ncbi:microsomal glutathione S-transferase 3-like isoform X1 [Branchiostoma floridae]|uniref:Glutathione S-transferase 3, mitochondrial n=1 Tax=Branchiostoma floridae TaxID=7739 RepID=A0A9J7LQ40_BRAFL|nr:microsomal glutathione S-transferase 3-like isoform X1 [Branchiostoma floridae]